MDMIQLYPWGDARLEKAEDVSVTFDGKDYSWTKYRIEPGPIARTRAQRLSETELEVDLGKDPDPYTTAPVLSNASAAATGANKAEGTVDTDEADGILYWVVTTSGAAPSPSQVKAGEDDSGGAAAAAGAKLIGTTGTQLAQADGLSGSTTYYFHYMQKDEAKNQSAVASSGSITTS